MTINMTQALTFETDDLDSFGLMLKSSIQVLFPKTKGHYINFHIKTEEPSRWDNGKLGNHSKPKRLWIATLSDYASDFSSEDISCTNHKNFVKKAMEIVEKFPKDRVFDELGSGRHCGFNSFDGSIDVAYRMQWAPMGGWNLLHLSATHAYYGK